MHRRCLTMAAGLGALAVGLGAFGAHGLKDALGGLDPDGVLLGFWHTAAHYHLCHALALGLCAATAGPSRAARISCWAFGLGIGVFSGSLYAMALTGFRWLGVITPVGGILLVVGWVAMGFAVRRNGDTAASG